MDRILAEASEQGHILAHCSARGHDIMASGSNGNHDSIIADSNESGIKQEGEEEEEEALNIALRTRSHFRIDDFVPEDNLNFPDVDMKLYQDPDSEGDPEYKKFLNQCYSEELGTDTNNDDNDPEYVYNDDIFSHGWRFDLNEVRELHQDDSEMQPIDDFKTEADAVTTVEHKPSVTTSNQTTLISFRASPSKLARRKIDMFKDPEFARILNQQLRQHIQLLTQTFLLTRNTTNMRNESEEAKSHLCSYMKIFKNKSKPSNLLPAMSLVNNLETPKDLRSSIRLSWRPLPIPDQVKDIIRDNPNVFIYPSLLPQVAFSFLPEKLIPKKPKINFTFNEDKLLAYALNEFKGETAPYAFIASLLMTAKTKTQISNHIKNIKRSPGNENNPIKLYYSNGQLPEIDLDSDSSILQIKEEPNKSDTGQLGEEEEEHSPVNIEEQQALEAEECLVVETEKHQLVEVEEHQAVEINDHQLVEMDEQQPIVVKQDYVKPDEPQTIVAPNSPHLVCEEPDDFMNMDLDDLMAASTTISKSAMTNSNNSESNINNNNKNIKNLKLKKSMLNLMSHNFLLSKDMGDLIIHEFLKTTQQKLSERNNIQLLHLLSSLISQGDKGNADDRIVSIYQEITRFLKKINAPPELHERVVLFLDLDQATKCGCSLSYLHWMRFFEFMQHVELYHDGVETLEKKLVRLLDALQKDDPHKVKLAIANLVNKHPFLKREFESLSLDEKPHPSLFICEEDFDDITDPIAMFSSDERDVSSMFKYEHFSSKLTKEELSYASQSCPCKCHLDITTDGNNGSQQSQHCNKCNLKFMKGRMYLVNKIKPILAEWSYTTTERLQSPQKATNEAALEWTFEEDREILEFCRLKAEQNEETISFDTSIFEELLASRQAHDGNPRASKKSAREIAARFNHLMDMYKDENSSVVQ